MLEVIAGIGIGVILGVIAGVIGTVLAFFGEKRNERQPKEKKVTFMVVAVPKSNKTGASVLFECKATKEHYVWENELLKDYVILHIIHKELITKINT